MSLRRYALLLAATAPLAACGNPSAPAPDNTTVAVDNTVFAEESGNVTIPVTPVEPTGTGIAATANDTAPVQNTAAPAEPVAKPSGAPKLQADYIGKWVGVEGMVLDVKANPKGGVRITNQWDLDNTGSFDGSVTAEGLRFMRKGEAVTASPGSGKDAGLKYLAGKKDCLIVKSGEGYCRD